MLLPRDHARLSRRGALTTLAVGVGVFGALNIVGCARQAPGGGSNNQNSPSVIAPTMSVTGSKDGILPDDPLTITVANGTLSKVTVTDKNGGVWAGTLKDDTWTNQRTFWPDSTYTVTAEVLDSKNGSHTLTQQITTAKTESVVYQPAYVQTGLGVGMPVYVQFASAISDKAVRATIEKRASVTTKPEQPGSWGWVDNRILMWRPQNYWQANSTATVALNFGGIKIDDDVYLADDTNYSISFGDYHVLKCDISTQHMQVYDGDTMVRDCPVSTGDLKKSPTLNGTKVIMEKDPSVIMDSSTYGVPVDSPGGYREKVDDCQRITNSGEFIHSAPWSVAQQGVTPVSNGCTNISPSNAKWLMDWTQVGDPVEYTGSAVAFRADDGIGCWVYDWASWQQRSALV